MGVPLIELHINVNVLNENNLIMTAEEQLKLWEQFVKQQQIANEKLTKIRQFKDGVMVFDSQEYKDWQDEEGKAIDLLHLLWSK